MFNLSQLYNKTKDYDVSVSGAPGVRIILNVCNKLVSSPKGCTGNNLGACIKGELQFSQKWIFERISFLTLKASPTCVPSDSYRFLSFLPSLPPTLPSSLPPCLPPSLPLSLFSSLPPSLHFFFRPPLSLPHSYTSFLISYLISFLLISLLHPSCLLSLFVSFLSLLPSVSIPPSFHTSFTSCLPSLGTNILLGFF